MRNIFRGVVFGAFMLLSSMPFGASAQMLSPNCASDTLQVEDFLDCVVECKAIPKGSSPIEEAICNDIDEKRGLYLPVVNALETLEQNERDIQTLQGRLSGSINPSAITFFRRTNQDYKNEVAGIVEKDKSNPFGLEIDAIPFVPEIDGPPADEKSLEDEYLSYAVNVGNSVADRRYTCQRAEDVYRATFTQKKSDLASIREVLTTLGTTNVGGIEYADLYRSVYRSNAKAQYLYESTKAVCDRGTAPPVAGSTSLPGPSNDTQQTDGGDAGITYFTERLGPGLINGFLVFGMSVAVIAMIIGGLMYVLSAFDPDLRNRAKDVIKFTIIGMVIGILSYGIVQFIVGLQFS